MVFVDAHRVGKQREEYVTSRWATRPCDPCNIGRECRSTVRNMENEYAEVSLPRTGHPFSEVFKSFTLRIEPADNGMIRVTGWVEPLDGTPVQPNSFLMREDGKDYPVTSAPFDSVSTTPVDATTSILIEKRDGKIVQKKRRVIDGNIMTDTTIFPDISKVEVWERQ